MAIKEYFKVAKESVRYVVLIPFIPVLFILMWVFGKSFEAGSKVPEDLKDQEDAANKK